MSFMSCPLKSEAAHLNKHEFFVQMLKTSKGRFRDKLALSGLQQTKDCKSEVFKAKVQGISRSAEAGIQQL